MIYFVDPGYHLPALPIFKEIREKTTILHRSFKSNPTAQILKRIEQKKLENCQERSLIQMLY
jgi:hypothetical protein